MIALPWAPLAADTRTYGGGFSTRWNTVGWHGHDQPLCPEADRRGPSACNDLDYRNANLDNSIGIRYGRERDSFEHGPLMFVLGIEGTFADSEYNLSQDHIAFFSTSAVAGIDYAIHSARLGARYGAGPYFTSDRRAGIQAFAELTGTLPIRPGAALRIAHRLVGQANPDINRGETSILLVASPENTGTSRWEFTTMAGTSTPHSFSLRPAAFKKMSAIYLLDEELQLQGSWTATAHESMLRTHFNTFPDNERGRTIESFGVAMRHVRPLRDALSVHYGAGVELADWKDPHRLLVRDGVEVIAGLEYGAAAAAGIRLGIARHLAIEGSIEHVWWHNLDLNETRWGVGLVLTR